MIDNSDSEGNWFVQIYARKKAIAQFQCPSLNDAQKEVIRIRRERAARKLFTGRAYARLILRKEKGKLIISSVERDLA